MIETSQILQQAEDIFFELASENLSDEKMALLQENASAMFIEINEGFDESWEALLYEEVDAQEYIELDVFLELENKKQRLALFLLGNDIENDKECHIQW